MNDKFSKEEEGDDDELNVIGKLEPEYIDIIKNPNAHFFSKRFPGEVTKTGPFNKDEKMIFMKRLEYFKELGIEGIFWGLFAIPITGRVGYQCANFYRKLKENNEIEGVKKTIYDRKVHEKINKESNRFIIKTLRKTPKILIKKPKKFKTEFEEKSIKINFIKEVFNI